MTSLILPSRLRRQPQQGAQLDRSGWLRGAQAVISAAQGFNYTTWAPLKSSGVVPRAALPGGVAWSFRKNFYVETEVQPAIGTQSFVEFWYGYPSAPSATQGDATNPTFLTGSSANNSAIVSSIGSGRGSSNWGALYNWSNGIATQFNDAGELLPAGILTLLVVVRRQSGMELWRDGKLIRSITQSPTNLTASSFILGAFVNAAFWTSSSDAILAGRVLTPVEPTAAEIKVFSDNPWQSFKAGNSSAYVAAIASAATSAPVGNAHSLPVAQGAYTITGNSIGLRAARRIIASAGAYSLAGNAAALRVARRLTAAPGAYSIVGNPANLVKGIAPRALQVAAGNYTITGNPAALRVARRLQAAPGAYAITGFAVADRVMPVITLSVRFDTLPRNFNLKTIHFSN